MHVEKVKKFGGGEFGSDDINGHLEYCTTNTAIAIVFNMI